MEGLSKVEVTQLTSQEPLYGSHLPVINDVVPNVSCPIASQRPRGSRSLQKRRESLFRKSVSTPFGYLLLRYDKVWQARTVLKLGDEDFMFELRISIVSRSLFSRKASVITGTWKLIPRANLTGLNLQFHPIAGRKSAIWTACRAGDIATMKELFQSKRASPHDVNELGEGLLIASTCNRE